MRGKRAQFFGLYLVALTLVMCGIVIGLYYVQQGNIPSSLVSPRAVLEVRDELEIFEMREVVLIKESLVSVKGLDFCDDGFSEKFKEDFISRVSGEVDMKKFIFEDLISGGRKIKEGDDKLKFIENVVYLGKLSECDDGVRSFSRAEIGKFIRLRVTDDEEVNYPVDFSFEFGREYTITFKDGEFEVK